MTNLKKVLIATLAIVLVLSICSIVLATDDFGIIPDGNTTVVGDPNNTTNNNTNDTPPTVINPVDTLGGTTANNSTNNTSTYNNTNNLPKTGVGDYTMVTAIILLAIVAVYAYKKVKDYKNI